MAGELSNRIGATATIAGVAFGGTTLTVLADGGTAMQKTLGIVTNGEFDVPVDISTVLCMAIEADNDCTVKTNSTSAPTDTIALKAKSPLIWATGYPAGMQFLSADVTKFYITTTVATIIKFAAGTDTTPVI